MADHVWEGENRSYGAKAHVFVSEDMAEAESECTIAIFSEAGDTVRHMTMDVEAGWQSIVWRGDSDGVAWPSRKVEDEEHKGGGVVVPPGTYKAELELGDEKVSIEMSMRWDPRVEWNEEAIAESRAFASEMQQEVVKLSEAMQVLARMNQAMDAMESAWSALPDSLSAEVDSLASAVQSEIKALHDELWVPKDFVGYDHVTERVMDVVYEAQGDVFETPSANALRKRELAVAEIDRMVSSVEALEAGMWSDLLNVSMSVDLPALWDAVQPSQD